MSDENIEASPHKEDSSKHHIRRHRKNKRRNLDLSITASFTLDAMYWEGTNAAYSDQDLRIPSGLESSQFDPFEDQRLLVAADRLDGVQAHRDNQRESLHPTQGFHTCAEMESTKNNEITSSPWSEGLQLSSGQLLSTIPIKEVEITDTELFLVCEEVEKEVSRSRCDKNAIGDSMENELFSDSCGSPLLPQSQINQKYLTFNADTAKNVPPMTPQFAQSKSVVDMILHDFCSSQIHSPENIKPLGEVLETVVETPQSIHYNSVVKGILEDFCSSPLSPEIGAEVRIPEDATPVFNCKNQILRTYSRRNKTLVPQNIEQKLALASSLSPRGESDAVNDSSSDLSVQEDVTQKSAPVGPVKINNSQLCDNFLNLSAYFSQNSENSVEHTTPENPNPNPKEAVPAPKSSQTSLDSLEDFYGYCSDSNEKFCKNHRAMIDGELVYDGTRPLPDQNILREKKATALLQNIKPESIEKKVTVQHDEDLFENNCDEWIDDLEFFANFRTQDILNEAMNLEHNAKVTAINNHISHISFQTASKKSINISEEAKKRAQIILENLPPLEYKEDDENSNNLGNSNQGMNQIDASGYNQTTYPTFQTASKKSISISEAAKKRAQTMFENLPPLEYKEDDENSNNLRNPNQGMNQIDASGYTQTTYPTFQTASKKSISISEAAKKRAQTMFENLPPLEYPEENENIKEMINFSGHLRIHNCLEKIHSSYPTFQTASKKTINVSDDAKRQAQRILEKLPALEVDDDQSFGVNPSKGVEMRSVQIQRPSSDALENNENFKNIDFENMILSEWVFEDELKNEQKCKPIPEDFESGISSAKKPDSEKLNVTALKHSTNTIDGITKTENEFCSHQEEVAIVIENPETKMMDIEAEIISAPVKLTDGQRLAHKQQPKEYSEILPAEQTLATKRKIREEGAGDNSTQPTKFLCKSNSATAPVDRTPLNRLDGNGMLRASISDTAGNPLLPLSRSSSVRSRTNRLSLSRQRKRKTNMSSSTPVKPLSALTSIGNTPNTPQQQNFIDMLPHTSTPHLPKPPSAELEQKSNNSDHLDDMESDFKKIEWEDCNISTGKGTGKKNVSFTKLSESCCNLTLTEANPTPQQRIDRLRMYPSPPKVSPISLSNKKKCRTLGLRRTPWLTKEPNS